MSGNTPPPPMLSRAAFLFTVDLELAWGLVHSLRPTNLNLLKRDGSHGRHAVGTLLRLLDKHQVPATWATVGHLFLDRCHREHGECHPNMRRVTQDWYGVDPCSDIARDPLFYGSDILSKVMSSTVGHEIGYHSFSHVAFDGCSPEVAESEVAEGTRLAAKLGIPLRSFVFPHNRVGHVAMLKRHGFRIYRSRNLLHRAPRWPLGWAVSGAKDLLIATPCHASADDSIWEIPSSLYFSESRFPFTLVPRARLGLRRAIRRHAVLHVFLHDWNLVTDPSLAPKLDRLLASVARHRERGALDTLTMAGLADRLDGSDR